MELMRQVGQVCYEFANLGLVQYAVVGDELGVRELLESGWISDIDWRDDNNFTALMHATVNGHSDIVGLLLENGAQANASVDGETTPMALAVRSGQAQVIPVLIRGGANVLQQDSDGFTAFSRACQSGQISVVSAAIRTLLEVDAGQSIVALLKMTNNAGENPQDLAAKNGHWVVGDLLIQVGFDTYQEQDENEIDTVEELLADSSLDDDAIVNYLIEQEIDLHGTNADGEGLLFPAVVNERLGVVKYLLANGADPEHLGSRNWSTLMFASSEGQTEIVGELIQWKASVNFTDSCGIGALWLAAQSGECDTIMCLLDAGADINIQDAKGASPLHVAIANGHKETVNLLIQRHANVHLQDLDGLTPLILAALEGHSAIVAALLRAGSDYRHQLNLPSGGDALYHAAARGHESVVRILIDAGADPNAVTLSGYTALLGATAADNIGISCLLLNNGANPNIQSVGGQTALHHAVIRRNMSIVSILAEAGADVSIEDNNGCSAFEIAVIMGEFELADFLEDLPGTKPLHPDDKFGVWPVSVLLEFYNQDNTKMESVIPQWYIDPSTIEEFAPLKQDLRTTALVADGFWHGSKVTIIRPVIGAPITIPSALTKVMHVTKEMFVATVNGWLTANHPHVLKLFGACHRDEPFLVVEHSQGTLRSYLQEHPDSTWRVLHQIALGLQYLHERDIPHGNLHGDIITFSDDGFPKLGVSGLFGATNICSDNPQVNWWPHETVSSGTMGYEADMYSFGMCIIEAVTGEAPYAAAAAAAAAALSVKDMVMDNEVPVRHHAFNDRGWELVMSLTSDNPTERVSVDTVVQELEAIAAAEKERHTAARTTYTLDQIESRLEFARKLDATQTDSIQKHLLAQLKRISDRLTSNDQIPRDSTMLSRCFIVVNRFAIHLETRKAVSNAQIHSSGRQHAAVMKSIYNDVARLADDLEVDLTFEYRSWRDMWSECLLEQQRQFGKELEAVSESQVPTQIDETRAEELSCMLFEITKHRRRYGAVSAEVTKAASTKIFDALGGPLPDWFFPWYEVAITRDMIPVKGGFGEVCRGKWMGSNVVVKKCHVFDQKAFEREVEIWFKLHHPHVVKLFGACHVGQKFFVAEWAEHGQLDTYIASCEKIGRSVVWQKLHEAAFGLRYLDFRGIIHRDLKCNNILVGRDQKAKITDFGLSSPCLGNGIEDTKRFGNARWTAPEVLRGEMPSHESDVYSFGMCVVEAVTRRVPYADTRDGSLVGLEVAAGRFLSRPEVFLHDEHWALVTGCCALNPRERLTMDHIVATLWEFAEHERSDRPISHPSTPNTVISDLKPSRASINERELVSKASQRDSHQLAVKLLKSNDELEAEADRV